MHHHQPSGDHAFAQIADAVLAVHGVAGGFASLQFLLHITCLYLQRAAVHRQVFARARFVGL